MEGRTFPDGFLWGVATSAQQIEGGCREGGRGESIWDRFAATPGRIEDSSDARVACDHYHRWREDIDLMRWLGLNAYRFSVAWPRVLPRGRGAVNEAGLDFYDALVDALLEAGMQPFITLYHWDLPEALQERGGWAARETADAFVEYAGAVTRRLGDRVARWATHNEPWCIATLGHEAGEHAPGHKNPAEALRVAHHLLLSHGWATQVMRLNAPGAECGIVLILTPPTPATPSPADRDAARRFDGSFNRWYLDPLFRGRYPEDALADRIRRGHLAGPELSFVQPGDMEAIATPLDFLGVNYYSRVVVRAGADGEPVSVRVVPEKELTDMGWEVYPQGLHDLLLRVQQEYAPQKIYITENGAAYPDAPDGKARIAGDAAGRGVNRGVEHITESDAVRIADARRVDFLRRHLGAARQAIVDGVPLAGYFVWSLLDNFEWAHGYTRRFGLYRVDFATQQRTPRESAFWYRNVVAAGAVDDDTQPSASRRFP